MKRVFSAVAVLALLGGCDAGLLEPAAEPAAEGAPEVATPVEQAVVVSDAVVSEACRLFQFMADGVNVDGTGRGEGGAVACRSEVHPDYVELVSPSGYKIQATVVKAGDSFVPLAETVSHRTKYEPESGVWTSFGSVFIGAAGNQPLCMQLDYLAVDAMADSLFLMRSGEQVATSFGLPADPVNIMTMLVKQPVVDAQSVAAFAVMPREARTAVQSITFVDCPS